MRRGSGLALPRLSGANRALDYLEKLYPHAIGEALFHRPQRVRERPRGARPRRQGLRSLPRRGERPVLRPDVRALAQARSTRRAPTSGPDTGEWVVSNSTPLSGFPPFPGDRAASRSRSRASAARRPPAAGSRSRWSTRTRARSSSTRACRSARRLRSAARRTSGSRRSRDPGRRRGSRSRAGLRVAFKKLPTALNNANRWVVMATAPAIPAAAAARVVGVTLAILGALLAALALAALLGTSRRITRRAVQFAGLAHRIAGGDLEVRADERGADELAQLGGSLNHMVDSLTTVADEMNAIGGGDLTREIVPHGERDALGPRARRDGPGPAFDRPPAAGRLLDARRRLAADGLGLQRGRPGDRRDRRRRRGRRTGRGAPC